MRSVSFDRLAATAKLVLELFYPTCRIDETFFASVDRVRVHRDITKYLFVFYTIDRFLLAGLDGRVRDELLASRNVDENGRMIIWVNAFFHGSREIVKLTLTRFEARVGLVDHVETTLATYHLAVGMTGLG